MKKTLLFSLVLMTICTIFVANAFAQRGGRFGGGGFSRGGFSGGYSRNFGGNFNRGFSGSTIKNIPSGMNRGFFSRGRIGISVGSTFYRRLPRYYQTIQFRGVPYYFYDGLFFDFYGGYYRSIFPPIGLMIGTLPYGYWGFNYGGYPYFYHSGIYYQQQDNNYQVVQAPVGASVPQLPKDAKIVVINNENYFEYNGTYYKEYTKEDGTKWYLIAGLNGVLNTNNNDTNINSSKVAPEVVIISTKKYNVGDIVDTLPNNCKVVVINNKKYYVSTDNIYFEELIENNSLKYKVVGQ